MEAFLGSIVGQDEARAQLQALLVADRVPAGILLYGGAGRGKRAIAAGFITALMAGDRNGQVDPMAPLVRRIRSGAHPDLHVVEAAAGQRQLGIDRVRELKEEFGLRPLEAGRRAALIVDAHLLTEEAGNALLKLLEEPPPGSHLILTAISRESVLPTLLSRSVSVRVGPLAVPDVEEVLRRQGVAPPLAAALSRLAQGSPGRGLSLAAEPLEDLLAPARALLFAAEGPFEAAEAIVAPARKQGANLEAARAVLRGVLDLATTFLAAALRAGSGATRGGEALELLGDDAGRLVARPPHRLESDLAAIAGAGRELDRNVTPELVIGDLAARLAAG